MYIKIGEDFSLYLTEDFTSFQTYENNLISINNLHIKFLLPRTISVLSSKPSLHELGQGDDTNMQKYGILRKDEPLRFHFLFDSQIVEMLNISYPFFHLDG